MRRKEKSSIGPTAGCFGARLTALLKERSLGQKELADAFGVSPQTVSAWRYGSLPLARTLQALADFLSVEGAWLATGEGPKDRPKAKAENARLGEAHERIARAQKELSEAARLLDLEIKAAPRKSR